MPERLSHSRHHVRFIYCATDGQVAKLGSSRDPDARLIALRKSTGRDLGLAHTWCLGRMTGSSALVMERHVHGALGHTRRSDTEWYTTPVAEIVPVATAAISWLLGIWRRKAPTRAQAKFTKQTVAHAGAMAARTL